MVYTECYIGKKKQVKIYAKEYIKISIKNH